MPLQRRAILSTAFVVLVLGALTGPLVGRASAHADLLRSAPVDDELLDAVPDAVELTFTEAVEAGSGGVRVLGPDGERVEGEPTTSDAHRTVVVPVESGDRGTYTVAWRLVSEDGHTIEGSTVFHVGERTGAADVDGGDRPGVSALGGVGRWLGYAGSMVAVGALAFGRAVLGTWRLDGPRRRLVATGPLSPSLAGSLAVLLVSAALPSGRSLAAAGGLLGETVTGSRPGAIAAVRGLLALLLLVAALLPERRVPTPVTGALAVSLLLAPAVNGHAWTTDPRGLLRMACTCWPPPSGSAVSWPCS